MKSHHHASTSTLASGHHPWVATLCVLFGLGIVALAVFWLRKCKPPRHEYAAVTLEPASSSSYHHQQQQQQQHELDETMHSYQKRLPGRYRLANKLGCLGRRKKEWFIVKDTHLDADRMLALVELPPAAHRRESGTAWSRDLLVQVFRDLHHPYILPVLDIDVWSDMDVLCVISPLNREGSLRDIIYGRRYDDVYYGKEHLGRGKALSYKQVQCFGRQILEALIFLENCNFPALGGNLHCGNVIVQNGVARLAGLETVLMGQHWDPSQLKSERSNDLRAFGHVLFEMSTGCEFHQDKLHSALAYMPAAECADLLDTLLNNSIHGAACYSNNHQYSNNPSRIVDSFDSIVRHEMFKSVELRELLGRRVFDVTGARDALHQLQVSMTTSPSTEGGGGMAASTTTVGSGTTKAKHSKRSKSRLEHRDSEHETNEQDVVTDVDAYHEYHAYGGEEVDEQLTVTLVENR